MKKMLGLVLALCLICGLAAGASASTFTDAHGNVIELDDSLEAPHLQLAAMLMIAKTAYPEFFGEISVDHALEMLAEEATGSIPAGIFYYSSQGGL